MGIFIAPGVYSIEEDFSDYAMALSTSIAAFVGWTPKGKTDEPIFLSSQERAVRKLGRPVKESLSIYSALAFLEKGSQLWFKRVVGPNAKKASALITDGASTPTNVLKVEAVGEGEYYNKVGVKIQKENDSEISIYVFEDGELVESYRYKNFNPNDKEYVGNIKSDLVKFIVLDNSKLPAEGTYILKGGDDDLANLTSTQIAAGLRAFQSPENIDINILAAPGWADPVVINEGLTICENRGDCMFIAEVPFGLEPAEAVEWHNGNGGAFQAFNSSYGAMYYNWLLTADIYNGGEIWLPPSGFIAAQYAYTDQVAEPWFAPAGFVRGRITRPLKTERVLTRGDIELLYGNQNAINPLQMFKKDGITIWGQRTLQRRPSATDRVNVRRLMLYIRKVIATSVKYLTFEPADPITWRRWVGIVEPFMRSIQRRRGVYSYKVICDETTNTPEVINNNQMVGLVELIPTKTAEVIVDKFRLLPYGADFENK